MQITKTGNPGGIASGCLSGPAYDCIDSVPATYLSGSWIEYSGSDVPSEWTITEANNGQPGIQGSVSGYVEVYPIADSCPTVTYQITALSDYSPSLITPGVEGTTVGTWVATNPSPATSCGGYTPVSQVTFNLSVMNRGNDLAVNNWTNSSGLRGSDNLTTNLVLTPTSENLSVNGTGNPYGQGFGAAGSTNETQLQVNQTLVDATTYDPADPNSNKFQGRQVYEIQNGTPTDSCFDFTANPANGITGNPTPRYTLPGSVWNVGSNVTPGNRYGPDNIGWTRASVVWYQSNLPSRAFPCQAVIPQAMYIVNDISDPVMYDQQFSTHTLTVTITQTTVTVQKDSTSSTLTFPHP